MANFQFAAAFYTATFCVELTENLNTVRPFRIPGFHTVNNAVEALHLIQYDFGVRDRELISRSS